MSTTINTRLHVNHMPLSWMCENENSPTMTGRRVWGDMAGEARFSIERNDDALCLIDLYSSRYMIHAIRGENLWHSDNIAKLIAIAEHHEGSHFNSAHTPTPR